RAEVAAIELAVCGEHVGTEFVADGGEAGLAGFDDLAGEDVRVDEGGAEGFEEGGDGGFAAGYAAGEADLQHGSPTAIWSREATTRGSVLSASGIRSHFPHFTCDSRRAQMRVVCSALRGGNSTSECDVR